MLIIGLQLSSVAILVATLFLASNKINAKHHGKAFHLSEIVDDVCWCGLFGVIVSWNASFRGDNSLYAGLSTLLFTIWLFPVLGINWFGDWPGRSWAARGRTRTNPALGFVGFGISSALIGVGTYFACLNSSMADIAVVVGLTIGGAVFCIGLLLGLFAEVFTVPS